MAENHTQVNSYQDKLLEAMQIVSSQLISSIPYDKTITCTIINDEEKEKGKYKVANGDAVFDAFSSDTRLKKDDVVYVTIPEGNYDNQKIIQGKKTSDAEKPFVFITPFDTLLDVTTDLATTATKKGIIANNKYITTEIEKEVNGEIVTEEVIKKMYPEYVEVCNLDVSHLNLTGYTRLGIKANFMSWLPEVRKGSYGLRITATDNLNTTTTNDQKVTSVQQTKVMLLDSSDMYGNPFNFENYYSQEKVFPITELNTITNIKIELYQIAGSFFDVNNNILTLSEGNVERDGLDRTYSATFGENIFVDDVYLCLGYDVSEITDELIVPVITDSMTYSAYREPSLNKKEINLRWVHQFEDGPLVVNPARDFDKTKDSATLKDCEIRWYRYRLGAAAADEYCGVYWTGLTVTKENDKYILSEWNGDTKPVYQLDADGNKIKDSETDEYIVIDNVPDYKETQALENVVFTPNTNYQTEQIKAIIYLNGVAIRGPVITFENEESTSGKEVSDFMNALEIECVDGTQGNYLLYNEAGQLLNSAESNIERKLACGFAKEGELAKSALVLDYDKGDTISWKFPILNTMVSLQRCGNPNANIYELITLTSDTYIYNTYYTKDKETEKYILSNDGFVEGELYYEQKQAGENTIQPSKVWTQINEFDYIDGKEDEVIFELKRKYRDDETLYAIDDVVDETDKELEYYSLWNEGKEYYRNKEIRATIPPYYEVYYEPWNIYKDKYENYLILERQRTLSYNSATKLTEILYPTYKINPMYSMYNMNNTIACTIRKDRVIYTSEKEFTFGIAGTMGSDKSIIVDFVGGHTAISAEDLGVQYELEVRMYDENNKPQDLSSVPVRWSWYKPGHSASSPERVSNVLSFNGADVQENASSVMPLKINGILTPGNAEQIYIVQVDVGESGAELTTYFPIPIKSSEKYSHIEGATSVIYLSNGEPEYYKGDYKLYETIDDTVGSPNVKVTDEAVVWQIVTQETTTKALRYIADINVEKDTSGNIIGYKGLSPISIYTSGVKNYAVIAKVNNKVVWHQPILVVKNKYPSRVINKWDGKTLTTDEGTGTILSTAIAAGRKESDNTFTGVMIGDWTGSISDRSLTEATGVFGYHQGEMSYALTDKGKFFIGKDGKGRIEFNGDNGTISGGYDTEGENPNMTINLSNGQINAENFTLKAGNFGITGSDVGQFIVLNTESDIPLPSLGIVPSNHGNYPFEIGRFFKADYKGRMYAEEGTLGAWRFSSTAQKDTGVGDGHLSYKSAGSLYSGNSSVYSDIILDPVRNTVTGGRFRASILEALSGTIKLGGYLSVYDNSSTYIGPHTYSDGSTVNELTYTAANAGGILGFMQADMGGEKEIWNSTTNQYETQRNAGIGMSQTSGGTVKATTLNAGMSYNSYYLSLQEERIVMRGSTARLILQESNGTEENDVARSSLGYGSSWLACYGSGLVSTHSSAATEISAGTSIDIKGPSGIKLYTSDTHYLNITTTDIVANGPFKVGQTSSSNNKNATIYGKLLIGTGDETADFSHTYSLNVASGGAKILGGAIIIGNSTFQDILSVGYSTPQDTSYKLNVNGSACITNGVTINAGGITVSSGGANITGYSTFQNTLSVGYSTPQTSYSLTVNGSVYTANSMTINSGGLTVEAGTTNLNGGLTVPEDETVTFTGTTQYGIRAQFA